MKFAHEEFALEEFTLEQIITTQFMNHAKFELLLDEMLVYSHPE
jgi:hypothetical protein